MFDPIILIVIDITSKILFNSLVESFYFSIGLEVKSYRKFIIYSKLYYEYCEEFRDKGYTFIYNEFV